MYIYTHLRERRPRRPDIRPHTPGRRGRRVAPAGIVMLPVSPAGIVGGRAWGVAPCWRLLGGRARQRADARSGLIDTAGENESIKKSDNILGVTRCLFLSMKIFIYIDGGRASQSADARSSLIHTVKKSTRNGDDNDKFTPTKHIPPPPTITTAAGPQRLTPARRHHYKKGGGGGGARWTALTDSAQN